MAGVWLSYSKNKQYNEAISLIENKQYGEAYTVLMDINDDETTDSLKKQYISSLIKDNNYKEAYRLVHTYNDHSNNQEQETSIILDWREYIIDSEKSGEVAFFLNSVELNELQHEVYYDFLFTKVKEMKPTWENKYDATYDICNLLFDKLPSNYKNTQYALAALETLDELHKYSYTIKHKNILVKFWSEEDIKGLGVTSK